MLSVHSSIHWPFFLFQERALSDAREQLGKIKTEKIGLPPPSSSLKYRDTNMNKHLLDSEDESEGLSDSDDI